MISQWRNASRLIHPKASIVLSPNHQRHFLYQHNPFSLTITVCSDFPDKDIKADFRNHPPSTNDTTISWKHQDTLEVEASPNYYRERPHSQLFLHNEDNDNVDGRKCGKPTSTTAGTHFPTSDPGEDPGQPLSTWIRISLALGTCMRSGWKIAVVAGSCMISSIWMIGGVGLSVSWMINAVLSCLQTGNSMFNALVTCVWSITQLTRDSDVLNLENSKTAGDLLLRGIAGTVGSVKKAWKRRTASVRTYARSAKRMISQAVETGIERGRRTFSLGIFKKTWSLISRAVGTGVERVKRIPRARIFKRMWSWISRAVRTAVERGQMISRARIFKKTRSSISRAFRTGTERGNMIFHAGIFKKTWSWICRAVETVGRIGAMQVIQVFKGAWLLVSSVVLRETAVAFICANWWIILLGLAASIILLSLISFCCRKVYARIQQRKQTSTGIRREQTISW